MGENTSPQMMPEPVPAAPNPWPRTILTVVALVLVVGSGVYMFKSCRDLPGDVVTKTGEALRDVASAFKRSNTISTTFTSYAVSITNSQYLQFATLKQHEIFTRTEEPSTGYGYIPLPEVVVEARAPVDYTYYLDLNEEWRMVLQNNVIHVYAPPIRFNKPAIDVSKMSYEVRKGSVLTITKRAEVMENLKKSLTGLVIIRARENIPLVRENGRRQAGEFVEKWLSKSFTDGTNYAVKVHFADEKPPEGMGGKGAPLN